jgi:hypothetical protein
MSAVVIRRFPPRRMGAVFICKERDGSGWLAIAGAHAWLFGLRDQAVAAARWLARNLGFPIREAAT